MVLGAENIGEDDMAVALLDKAHRDARDVRLDGHAGGHERQRRAAHRGHGRRAVGLHDFGHDADGVRETFFVGKDGRQRRFGQVAVADFAAAHRAEALDFADGKRREVVVEHVRLVVFALDVVDVLFVKLGAQRGGHQRLRFAPRKERRTVGARQDVEVAGDLPDGVAVAAGDADALFDDRGADILSSRVRAAPPR